MKFSFNTNYSAEELDFLTKNNCEILSELKLSRVGFTEIPQRMIKYCGTYVAEISDEEGLSWAVLSKSRTGAYIFTSCYSDLPSMAEGL